MTGADRQALRARLTAATIGLATAGALGTGVLVVAAAATSATAATSGTTSGTTTGTTAGPTSGDDAATSDPLRPATTAPAAGSGGQQHATSGGS